MLAYIENSAIEQNTLDYIHNRIKNVRLGLGFILHHADQHEEIAQRFLFGFNNELCGLLFMYDGLYDWTGEELVAPTNL